MRKRISCIVAGRRNCSVKKNRRKSVINDQQGLAMATGALSHSSHGRHRYGRSKNFPFRTGDLVLVKWDDGMVYFAKIKRIDQKRERCTVVFDDKSQDETSFSQIHSGEWSVYRFMYQVCKL